jgi:hypothetical protein
VSDDSLAELEKSELLSSDFPRRSGMSHAQVASDAAAYQRTNAAAATPAATLVAGISARLTIEKLAKARHEPAVPLLIRFWSNCPIKEV